MKIRALIVDDEAPARKKIKIFLRNDPEIEIAGECANGAQAIADIQKLRPDLVFLDVQMPEPDGFGVLRALAQEQMPVIIFVTAHDQYALQAFEAHALDYLLKPFDRERFQQALQRAKTYLRGQANGGLDQRLLALLADRAAEPKPLKRLVIKASGRVFFLKADEIDWIEAAGSYIMLHAGKERHLLRESMNAIAGKLDPDKFLRIHRSTIVNLERVKELQTHAGGEYVVILRDGTSLTSSRGYSENLQKLLKNPL